MAVSDPFLELDDGATVVDATECGDQQSAGLRRSWRYRRHRSACVDDKLCLRASGGEVGRPAHRATELGRR